MIQDTTTENDGAPIPLAEDDEELQDVLEGLSQLEQTPPVVLFTGSFLGDVPQHSA
jgi:hypothetical protein